jgi:hypothetical protein
MGFAQSGLRLKAAPTETNTNAAFKTKTGDPG